MLFSQLAFAGKAEVLANATMGENISGGLGDFHIQSRDIFNSESSEAIWFGTFKGFMTAYKANLSAEWMTPAGELFKREKFTTKYGNANFGWAKLDIKGVDKSALELEGEWMIKVYWDEELIDQRNFFIGTRKFAKVALPEESVALTETAGTADGYIRLAKVYFKKNEIDSAINSLLRAENTEPDSPAAYLILGSVYNSIGKPDDAVLQFSKAQQLKADPVAVHRGLGNAYAKLELVDDAIKEYESLLKIKPDSKEDEDRLNLLKKASKSSGQVAHE
jgi:tetratricopeptide (TPR) repeat protein